MMEMITVEKAIRRAVVVIIVPILLLFLAGLFGVTILIMRLVKLFAWHEAMIVVGVFIGIIAGAILTLPWSAITVPRWKIWAFERVDDVHLLYREAGRKLILPQDKTTLIGKWEFRTKLQTQKLQKLEMKLKSPRKFIDDPSVPEETHIYSAGKPEKSKAPLIINSKGITTLDEGFMPWSRIDGYITVSVNVHGRHNISDGLDLYIQLKNDDEPFNIELGHLNKSQQEIQTLIDLYRDRYDNY
jgi:hypothetical protein